MVWLGGLPRVRYLYAALLFEQSYRDFHADLFPDTTGCEAQLSAAQWLQGHNASVPRISLDPAKRSAGENAIQVVANTEICIFLRYLKNFCKILLSEWCRGHKVYLCDYNLCICQFEASFYIRVGPCTA